jgi:hypothetical protein
MIAVFFSENVAPVSLWKTLCHRKMPVAIRKSGLFHEIPLISPQGPEP